MPTEIFHVKLLAQQTITCSKSTATALKQDKKFKMTAAFLSEVLSVDKFLIPRKCITEKFTWINFRKKKTVLWH